MPGKGVDDLDKSASVLVISFPRRSISSTGERDIRRGLKAALDHFGELNRGLRNLDNNDREGSCGLIVAGTSPSCALISLGCGGFVPTFLLLEYRLKEHGWQETNQAEGGPMGSLEALKFMVRTEFQP